MTESARPGWKRARGRPSGALLLILLLTALGLFLRIEHAMTFDGPKRGSDYAVYVQGVRWMMDNHRPFNFNSGVNYQVRYQPPLWYAAAAVILKLTDSERAIAGLSVMAWLVRQWLLSRFLFQLMARKDDAVRVAILGLHAVLPISVLIDGKVNPESFHATMFTLGVYLLFRIEREASHQRAVSARSAIWFGLVAGLAVLTKATSFVLMLAAAGVFLFQIWRGVFSQPLALTWRGLVRPGLLAAVIWCGVAGWWCGPNYLKYGHPFPHVWNQEGPETHAILAKPTTYRRPLGWLLPFDWEPYLKVPLIVSPEEPRPNFWSVVVTGTWTDFYNRGFCRLTGPRTQRAWGGSQGFMAMPGVDASISQRCIELSRGLLPFGMWLSTLSVVAFASAAMLRWRTAYRGSLALPLCIAGAAFFVMLFALAYPFDWAAVLNPRYLLPASTGLLACLGFWLSELPRGSVTALTLRASSFVAIAAVGMLLIYERFAP